jgi:hypothetical protein
MSKFAIGDKVDQAFSNHAEGTIVAILTDRAANWMISRQNSGPQRKSRRALRRRLLLAPAGSGAGSSGSAAFAIGMPPFLNFGSAAGGVYIRSDEGRRDGEARCREQRVNGLAL